jgi:hypothetical protein
MAGERSSSGVLLSARGLQESAGSSGERRVFWRAPGFLESAGPSGELPGFWRAPGFLESAGPSGAPGPLESAGLLESAGAVWSVGLSRTRCVWNARAGRARKRPVVRPRAAPRRPGAPTLRAAGADLALQRRSAETTDYFHVLLRYERLRVILHGSMLVAGGSPASSSTARPRSTSRRASIRRRMPCGAGRCPAVTAGDGTIATAS